MGDVLLPATAPVLVELFNDDVILLCEELLEDAVEFVVVRFGVWAVEFVIGLVTLVEMVVLLVVVFVVIGRVWLV